MKTFVWSTVIYILLGFYTFGFVYNSTYPERLTYWKSKEFLSDPDDIADMESSFSAGISGVFWPFYWLGRISIEITK